MERHSNRHANLAGELILTFLAGGWAGLGLYYGLSGSDVSPTGNVFLAAAAYMGSWQTLEGLLLAVVVIDLLGLAVGRRWVRQASLALSIIIWLFVAFGLATRPGGLVTTATFGYAAFAMLAMAAYQSLSVSRRLDHADELLSADLKSAETIAHRISDSEPRGVS